MEWVGSGKKIFIPVKALSSVFRGILCRLLEHAVNAGGIKVPEECAGFKSIKDQCYGKKWVVYCEKPFSNIDSLVNYLGNYTHRVAISNNRILELKNGMVTFSYKDYKAAGVRKRMTLYTDEFILRFLQHVLPCGFYKVRYFGFLAMCNMKSKLSVCFDLIGKTTFLPALQGLSALEVWRNITGKDPLCCPKCRSGRLRPMLNYVWCLKTG